MMSMVDSVALSGKMYLQENDSNTYVVNPSGNPDNFRKNIAQSGDEIILVVAPNGIVFASSHPAWRFTTFEKLLLNSISYENANIGSNNPINNLIFILYPYRNVICS